jgi:hypothetical protein
LKKLLLSALSILVIGASNNAFAAGDAGCGLGSIIWSKNSKLLQLFAVTTNGSFGSQTFGITSGTSGCSASSLVNREQQIESFVAANENNLKNDMAKGQGETLTTLAALSGCQDDSSQAEFSALMKKNFSDLMVNQNTAAQKAAKISTYQKQANVCVSMN